MRVRVKPVWIILAMLLLILGVVSGWRYYTYYDLGPVDPGNDTVIVVDIPAGSNARQIAVILKQENLIKQERYFLQYCRAEGLDSQLKAGPYAFSPGQTLDEIAQQIAAGQIATNRLTIPEGFSLDQIGARIVEQGLCSEAEWQTALLKEWNYYFLADAPAGERHLEGYLFPDTYLYLEDTELDDLIIMMLDRFQYVWEHELAETADIRDKTVHEIVTIASLIERERLADEECETISGVIANRLRIDMPLQIDASILYALGTHKSVVNNNDLKIDSPYNTYLNIGLPPGPIASPGLVSMHAALNPEQHDYFYYVAKGDGYHQFSRTFSEHQAAIIRYQ